MVIAVGAAAWALAGGRIGRLACERPQSPFRAAPLTGAPVVPTGKLEHVGGERSISPRRVGDEPSVPPRHR
ncbi:hypothetical protein AB0903_18475 [Streptomyces sp. NPDC048389]|uniref:hypothetical protein n=1 Tax=Streptomyces sp. NPDC048389 TaxID=3154622 RepID=UPI003456A906